MPCKLCQGLGTVYDSTINGQVPCPECSQYIVCDDCSGTGIDSPTGECRVCNGSGLRVKKMADGAICGECSGTGIDSPTGECRACKGTGIITKELISDQSYVTCYTNENPEKIPDYYLMSLQGKDCAGNSVTVIIECDALAYALGFNNDAYLYQAFTYLFRVWRKGDVISNVMKSAHFLGMWLIHRNKKGE